MMAEPLESISVCCVHAVEGDVQSQVSEYFFSPSHRLLLQLYLEIFLFSLQGDNF